MSDPTDANLAFRLPWLAFKLHSPLCLIDARRALVSHVDERGGWSIFWTRPADRLQFRGKVKDDHFEIVRIISYRNSFIPLVVGHLSEDSNGTTVEIRMRMYLFTSIFMVVWMVGASVGAIVFFTLAVVRGESIGLLTPLLPVSGVMMVGVGFGSEAVKAERLLREIFKIDK